MRVCSILERDLSENSNCLTQNSVVETALMAWLPLLPFGDESSSVLWNTLVFVAFLLFIFLFNQKIQLWTFQRNVEKALRKLEALANSSREDVIQSVKSLTGSEVREEVNRAVNNFLEFFAIEPVEKDPYGVLRRLEHILDIRRDRFKDFIKRIAPRASKVEGENLEGILEAAIAVNFIYKVIRHFLILGKKTKSLFILMQLDMQMPLVMRVAEAYYGALQSFSQGKPIGDGLGPLVAAKLMSRAPIKKGVAEDIVMAETNVENRRVIILKAEGPGSNVGKPGEAVKRIIEDNGGKISRIIMVDAAAKLEGEKTGEIAEGVGAAIGDPGPEKFKIEEIATRFGIPIDAIIVKMGLDEALTVMRREIAEAADAVVDRILKAIRERTNEGDTVIVTGIGNTIGIA